MIYAIRRYSSMPTIRLASTYLAIIMVLSMVFSVIFFQVSTSNLNLQLQPTTIQQQPDNSSFQGLSVVNGTATEATQQPTVTNVSMINAELQQHISALRQDLLVRLVALNIGALLGGSAFSYYMARRTLRPMEEAMEMQARFASDASHELRTPLTIMQTEIEVVLGKTNLSLQRAKDALRSNHQEVTRLRDLSEGLLRLTHTPQSPPALQAVAVDEIVGEAINRQLKPAQAKRIAIADEVPRLSLRGDKQSLAQALAILLDNAIKYSPTGRTIYITGRVQGRYVLLEVRDEGQGIRATDLPHIFERFYRADTSRSSRRVSGYGLGLAIAQNIIQQHGGVITATSTLGKGSTFTIKLPA